MLKYGRCAAACSKISNRTVAKVPSLVSIREWLKRPFIIRRINGSWFTYGLSAAFRCGGSFVDIGHVLQPGIGGLLLVMLLLIDDVCFGKRPLLFAQPSVETDG